MKLQHQTEVGATPEKVWEFLQDTRAVVQCMPGAELVDELGDDRYEGVLRIAIGPLKMNYAGNAAVVERNAEARRIVLNASGRDKRGSGSVQAHVQLEVVPGDAGSRIDVVSDIDLTGRIASLGRGVRDVSNTMFVAFSDELSARIEGPGQSTPLSAVNGATSAREQGAVATATRTIGVAGTPGPTAQGTSEIKVFQLVLTITRERLADFLERLSARVRPR